MIVRIAFQGSIRDLNFGGEAWVLQWMTAAQDIHVDLMHVLYVYSRVMGGGGGGGGNYKV